jgi:hypothetical protein
MLGRYHPFPTLIQINMKNSAHELFKAIGGLCNIMIPSSEPKSVPAEVKKPLLVGVLESKMQRNYRKSYSHVLSDYITSKNMEVIHQRELKEVV